MPLFPRPARSPLTRLGPAIVGIGVLATLAMGFLPSPYLIERPGPTFDTLGDSGDGPLISIDDAPTYATDGELRLTTVSIVGHPGSQPTWFETFHALVSPELALVPMGLYYPEGTTVEQSNEQGAIEMQNSQTAAVAAALINQGVEVDNTVTVAGVVAGAPADGVLVEGDEIVSVNGETAIDVYQLRAVIAAGGPDAPVRFEILRDGAPLQVDVMPIEDETGALIVGIYPANDFIFPFEVDIELPNVGGPSAGLMFSLAIVDELTPGAMTGGNDWAGTGTISASGVVGPIGGIVQKMFGALQAGAEYFLAPAANCEDVVGNIPAGLDVYAVATLDDAIAVVEDLQDGVQDLDGYRCELET